MAACIRGFRAKDNPAKYATALAPATATTYCWLFQMMRFLLANLHDSSVIGLIVPTRFISTVAFQVFTLPLSTGGTTSGPLGQLLEYLSDQNSSYNGVAGHC